MSFLYDEPTRPMSAPEAAAYQEAKENAQLFVLLDGNWMGLQFKDQDHRSRFERLIGGYKLHIEVGTISGYPIKVKPDLISAFTHHKEVFA